MYASQIVKKKIIFMSIERNDSFRPLRPKSVTTQTASLRANLLQIFSNALLVTTHAIAPTLVNFMKCICRMQDNWI